MRFWLLALALIAVSIGCGGGSSSPVQAPTPQPRLNVKIMVGVPSAVASKGVASVVVTFIPVGEVVPPPVPPLTINVAGGSSDCVAAGAQTSCSGNLSVPPGQQNFTIASFSGINGSGAQLSVRAFTATITTNGQTIDISNANGSIQVVATLQVVVNPPELLAGTAAPFTVLVNAYDGSGKLITSPYNIPVALVPPPPPSPGQPPIINPPPYSSSVVLGTDGLVHITVTGPNQLFQFGYSGSFVNLPAGFTFSAFALSVPTASAQLTFATPTPVPTPTPTATPTPVPTLVPLATPSPGPVAVAPNVLFFEAPNQPAQTFVASEAGSTTFSAVSSNPAVATVSGTRNTFSVSPVGVGLAAITVTDGAGRTGTVYAYVNQSSVIISGHRRQP